MNSQLNYLLIGSGRVAKHFAHYFNLLGLKVTAWSRQDTRETLSGYALAADRILLLIGDSSIASFYEAHRDILPAAKLVHCSGSLVHVEIASAHPLMTFGPDLYDLATYKQMAFVCERERASFSALLPGLPNAHFEIAPEKKNFYHALCSLSGNFTALLWESVAKKFESDLGLSREALKPYLARTFLNLLPLSENSVLTGPLKRGDTQTVIRHLDSLKNQPEQNLYYAFMNYYFSQNPNLAEGAINERSRL